MKKAGLANVASLVRRELSCPRRCKTSISTAMGNAELSQPETSSKSLVQEADQFHLHARGVVLRALGVDGASYPRQAHGRTGVARVKASVAASLRAGKAHRSARANWTRRLARLAGPSILGASRNRRDAVLDGYGFRPDDVRKRLETGCWLHPNGRNPDRNRSFQLVLPSNAEKFRPIEICNSQTIRICHILLINISYRVTFLVYFRLSSVLSNSVARRVPRW